MGNSADYLAKRDMHRHYLNSPKWKEFRQLVLGLNGCKCEKCGGYGTDVHHKTYKRWGNEKVSDVQVLCRDCHEAHHRVERSCQRRSKAKRKRPSMSAGAILSYYPQSQLEKIAGELGISFDEMKRSLNCRDRKTCIAIAKKLRIHVILPRQMRGKKELKIRRNQH